MTTLLLPLLVWTNLALPGFRVAALPPWAGTYVYEEAPGQARAAMSWTLALRPENGVLGGELAVQGTQTAMKLKVRAAGSARDAQIIFVQGLAGSGYEQLQPGDVLFRLHKAPDGRLRTYWSKLRPRLNQKYQDGQPCFARR